MGWWESNRLLNRGDRGPDVERLQRRLSTELGQRLPATGVFGPETENAVKEFQRLNRLVQDGKAGPLTASVLFNTPYEFSIDPPPAIRQPLFTCWAAALESVLRSSWGPGRRVMTVADFVDTYRSSLGSADNDITMIGFKGKVVPDLRAFSVDMKGQFFRVEPLLAELGKHRRHIVLVHNLTGSVAHTVVVYGIGVRNGAPFFRVMDPLIGAYSTIDTGVLSMAPGLLIVSVNRIVIPADPTP